MLYCVMICYGMVWYVVSWPRFGDTEVAVHHLQHIHLLAFTVNRRALRLSSEQENRFPQAHMIIAGAARRWKALR